MNSILLRTAITLVALPVFAASAAAPILEYKFNETGTSAPSTGTNNTAVEMRSLVNVLTDYHGTPGSGVLGPGSQDRAFDAGTPASGMGTAGNGARCAHPADLATVDGLISFTASGWFMTQNATAFSNAARLVGNAPSSGGATGWFVQAAATPAGAVEVRVDDTSATTGVVWADTQKWIFFAVTYDGTQAANNVKVYKGYRTAAEAVGGNPAVQLVATLTINKGPVDDDTTAFHIGSFGGTRPFDGSLDNIRVHGDATNSAGALTLAELELLRNGDTQDDSDGDGLPDSWENSYFGNTTSQDGTGDPDGDGLNNQAEFSNNSKPNDNDTDDDGLNDGAEVLQYGTNPNRADTDGDGLNDGTETTNTPATNPTRADTDFDGLTDGQEVNTYHTNPTLADTDGDSSSDGTEVGAGTDPLNPASFPVVPTVGLTNVIISEVLVTNFDLLDDEDLQSPGWIELWNPTAAAVNMTGWHLTDDATQPLKWTLPVRTLNAGGRLLVFASGKNRTPASGNLHTNFKLGGGPDYVALTNVAGTVVHALDFPKQHTNVSYGFFGTVAPLLGGYFTAPTPNNANAASGLISKVEDTTFSVKRGIYDTAQTTTITTGTLGATLAYTTDGSLPSPTNGTQVPPANGATPPTVTLNISATTTLRAMAYKNGALSSNVDTQTYLFPATTLAQNGPPAGSSPTTWSHFNNTGDWAVDPNISGSADAAVKLVADDLKAVPSVSLTMNFNDMWGVGGIYISGEGVDKEASLELLNPDASKTVPNAKAGFRGSGKIRIFGGSSTQRWKTDKLSMRFRFDENISDNDTFKDSSVSKFSTLVLDARLNQVWVHGTDATQRTRGDYVRDQVVSDLQNAIGGYSFHSRPVHLYINGIYWGLYILHERPDEHFTKEYLGGETWEYSVQKHDASQLNCVRGPVSGGAFQTTDYTALIALSNADLTVAANYNALAAKLDLDDFVKYMLVNHYSANLDWGTQNWYASFNRVDPAGRWRYHAWDSEHSWRTPTEDSTTGVALGGGTAVRDDPNGPTHLHVRLMLNTEYKLKYADAVHKYLFNGGLMTAAKIGPFFEKRLFEINEAIRGESARWGDGRDTPARTRRDWLKEVNRILGYDPVWNTQETAVPASPVIPGRNATTLSRVKFWGWYPDQTGANGNSWVTEPPEFSQHGGNVAGGFNLSISKTPVGGAGTIYYTLNGSDPRVPVTGAIGATAQTYSAVIPLAESGYVKARTLNGTQWSPLTEAFFTVNAVPASAANLVVSEIMYHPLDPTPAEVTAGYNSENDFEFVELLNIGAQAVDLSNVTLSGAVDFNFNNATASGRFLPPGGRLVVVENAPAFTSRYGAANVAGEFNGNLNNSGETLTVKAADVVTVIKSFAFNDKEPWPTAADGTGPSLVLNNATMNPDHTIGTNWRASFATNGAPGVGDSTAPQANPLGDDNANGTPNLIEYATGGDGDGTASIEQFTPGGIAGDYFVFRFRRDRRADGITLTPELTTDFAAWSNAALQYVSTAWNADGTATHTYRSNATRTTLGTRVAARLRVSLP